MAFTSVIGDPDVILIGSGIMSANLGVLLKQLDPNLRIQVFEVADRIALESSNAWNNAGTGHAGICELSYTPDQAADGTVDVSKAIEIFEQFELSRQFWGSCVREKMIASPGEFINQVPHISFVHGQEQVDYLRARYEGLSRHHYFTEMEFTTDPDRIRSWAPLLMEGREDTPVAATKMDAGTDVNFGALSEKLIKWLAEQDGCGVATSHRVYDLKRTTDGWAVSVHDQKSDRKLERRAKFVFVGAGGGTLPLLQKSKICEAKGFGGFPIGGQWLVCDNPTIVGEHQAKVYGQALDAAPTMAVPHLDTRVINGRKSLLFGPFATWTTKFLHRGGKLSDLPLSVRADNLSSLVKAGLYNVDLVRYLIRESTQSTDDRMEVLRLFYPNATRMDWRLVNAGIRVQTIKKEDGKAGIVHYGTEIVSDSDQTIAALLGASPGASVSVSIALEVIEKCLPDLLTSAKGKQRLKALIPSYGKSLTSSEAESCYQELSAATDSALRLNAQNKTIDAQTV